MFEFSMFEVFCEVAIIVASMAGAVGVIFSLAFFMGVQVTGD
jgi:hypothetical protein